MNFDYFAEVMKQSLTDVKITFSSTNLNTDRTFEGWIDFMKSFYYMAEPIEIEASKDIQSVTITSEVKVEETDGN